MKNTEFPRGTKPSVVAPDTATFERPSWATRPVSFSDSTPRVTTAELRRPIFTSDSTPHISTGDLLRPGWAKAS